MIPRTGILLSMLLAGGCAPMLTLPPAPQFHTADGPARRGRMLAQVVDNPRIEACAGVLEGEPHAHLVALAMADPEEAALRRRIHFDYTPEALRKTPRVFRGEVVNAVMRLVTVRKRKVRMGRAATLTVAEGMAWSLAATKQIALDWFHVQFVLRDGEPVPKRNTPYAVSGRFLKNRLYRLPDGTMQSVPYVVAVPPSPAEETLSWAQRLVVDRIIKKSAPLHRAKPVPGVPVDRRPVIDIHPSGDVSLDGRPTSLGELTEILAKRRAAEPVPAVVVRVEEAHGGGAQLEPIVKAVREAKIGITVLHQVKTLPPPASEDDF